VIAGLRGEDSIAELCRKEGINYQISLVEGLLAAGKKQLASDTACEATGDATSWPGSCVPP
jgi:transposase